MIKGLDKLLLKVSKIEGVKSITPGRISSSKNADELYLTIQYEIEGGVRCLAKGEGIQEVFIICSDIDGFKKALVNIQCK